MDWKCILFPLPVCSPCTLSFLQIHTIAFTCTHNNCFTAVCGVTNFSWALDLGVRERERGWEGENEREEKQWSTGSSEEAAHTQQAWYHLLCHPLADSLSVLPHKPVHAQSTLNAYSLYGTISIWSLFTPQLHILETNHNQCTRQIEI